MQAGMRSVPQGWWIVGAVFLASCQSGPGGPGMQTVSGPGGKAAPAVADLSTDVSVEAHLAAGRFHESQSQISLALEQYRAALARDPKSAVAHNGIGVCLMRQAKYDQAERHLRVAVQAMPDRAHFRNNLAFCYLSQRKWSDAEAELRKALELSPQFVRAWVNLGVVLAQQRRMDEALAAFRTVLSEADAQFNMGLMYQSLGRPIEAVRAYRETLRLNPKMVAAEKHLEAVEPKAREEERRIRANEPLAAVPQSRQDVALKVVSPQPPADPPPSDAGAFVPDKPSDPIGRPDRPAETQTDVRSTPELCPPLYAITTAPADFPAVEGLRVVAVPSLRASEPEQVSAAVAKVPPAPIEDVRSWSRDEPMEMPLPGWLRMQLAGELELARDAWGAGAGGAECLASPMASPVEAPLEESRETDEESEADEWAVVELSVVPSCPKLLRRLPGDLTWSDAVWLWSIDPVRRCDEWVCSEDNESGVAKILAHLEEEICRETLAASEEGDAVLASPPAYSDYFADVEPAERPLVTAGFHPALAFPRD